MINLRWATYALYLPLALSACGKPSVDERFKEMYEFQQKHDPATAASTADAYKYRDKISDEQKLQMIEMYDHIRQTRERLGVEPSK